MSMESDLRFIARSVGFVGLTVAFLARLESERRLSSHHKETQEETLHRSTERYGKSLLRLYGLKIEVRSAQPLRLSGRDARSKGRIFVVNHQSMFDIFVAMALVEAHLVSRADLAQWPVIGVTARRMGTLFVDRASKKSGAALIRAVVNAVDRGCGVLIYPEGTTHTGDFVHEFQSGGFLAARLADAEVVPMGIAYSGHEASFGEEPFAAHLRRVSGARTTRVGLALGEPIRPPHPSIKALQTAARERVQSLVHEARLLIS